MQIAEEKLIQTDSHRDTVKFALDVGELLQCAGGEIGRVEDTIERICKAYGAIQVDVFAITSCLFVTSVWEDGTIITQNRRIRNIEKHTERIEQLNALSRELCEKKLSPSEARSELERIKNQKKLPKHTKWIGSLLVCASYTLFFGGTPNDSIASLFVATVIFGTQILNEKTSGNQFLSQMLCAFFATSVSILCVRFNLGVSVDRIMIGCIMLLIPGISLTGAIENLLMSDTVSGIIGLIESLMIALFLAGGYALSITLLGGLLL